jgi:DNA (cytosine-5)-methyltransferase 1
LNHGEIIVDSFAGGGGASLGISWALGRGPDIAINHDKEAIALHAANHPDSVHLAEDVWHVDPVQACAGRPVGLMWLSPDCKHFSKAKGGKPVSKKIRGLAWVAVRWAKAVRPRVIVLENVEEFQTWGPVDRVTQRPDAARKGLTFKRFVGRLRTLGYSVEWKELRACDYGAPTIRKRLFLIARCDGQPIVWPQPTHGKNCAHPWRTAAECIEWGIPCPSIFLTKEEGKAIGVRRPLAPATLRRIARGLKRFVIDTPNPFLVTYYSSKREGDDRIADLREPLRTQSTENRFGLVAPHVIPLTHHGHDRGQRVDDPLATVTGAHRGEQALVGAFLKPRYTEREGQAPRVRSLEEPAPVIVPTGNGGDLVAAFLAKHYGGNESPGAQMDLPISTITTQDHHHLVTSHLSKLYGTSVAQSADEPLHTVTAGGTKLAEVRAFLVAYYGNEKDGGALGDPMRTVTSKERFGLVTVDGVDYAIADIGMRMLAPRELYRAQGFPDTYQIDVLFTYKDRFGRRQTRMMTKTAQVRMVGNSVCPPLAAAIVSANVTTPAVEVAA